MKLYAFSRLITVLLFGILGGISTYHGQIRNETLGRDEFLRRAGLEFDRHLATPPSPAKEIIETVLIMGFGFGLYELLSFGILKLLQLMEKKDRHSRRRRHQY